jgi:hypothetical protein
MYAGTARAKPGVEANNDPLLHIRRFHGRATTARRAPCPVPRQDGVPASISGQAGIDGRDHLTCGLPDSHLSSQRSVLYILPVLMYPTHEGSTPMNEAPVQTPSAEQVKPMSLSDKLVGVFASPSELYDNVRQTPPTSSNWVIPTLILVVVGVIMAYLVVSNPTLSDQMKRIASEQMEKGLQRQLAAGKITQEQANQARDQMSGIGQTGALISKYVIAVVGPFVSLFVAALVYWLLGKGVMKATAPYMKVVEVVGLTFFIVTIESVVTTILSIGMNSVFASPSLALLISDFSVDNKMHLLAASMNVFSFWTLGITSIGLARLFQKDLPKVLVLVFALWIVWILFTVFGLTALRG